MRSLFLVPVLLVAVAACGAASTAQTPQSFPEPSTYAWWDSQRVVPEAAAPAPSSSSGTAPASVDTTPDPVEVTVQVEPASGPASSPAALGGGDDDEP
jgi:hypothetical protein